jgi:hypothetical protein
VRACQREQHNQVGTEAVFVCFMRPVVSKTLGQTQRPHTILPPFACPQHLSHLNDRTRMLGRRVMVHAPVQGWRVCCLPFFRSVVCMRGHHPLRPPHIVCGCGRWGQRTLSCAEKEGLIPGGLGAPAAAWQRRCCSAAAVHYRSCMVAAGRQQAAAARGQQGQVRSGSFPYPGPAAVPWLLCRQTTSGASQS